MKTPRATNLLLAAAALAWLACVSPPRAAAQRPEAQKSADEKFERGRRLYQQGDASGAIPLLRDAAEHRKGDAGAWYYLGLALSRAGKAKDARAAFEKTLKLRPDDALAHVGLAYSLLRLDKLADAEREAARARSLDPQLAEAHYVVGVIRFADDKFREAAEEAEAALKLKPELAAAEYLLGDALLNIYGDEVARLATKNALAPAPTEAESEAELKPLKARMLDAAERLDAFAAARPNDPDAATWREQAESLRLYGRTGGKSSAIFRTAEVTQRAVIISKPEPGYSERARQHGTQGVVRLRVVLAADARVRYILVLKRLPDGLTEKSIEAARKIRFTPATINGQPVSQFVVLEYNFNVY
ncbi:MAG: TonB family protein [Acidobacteriota bacterium]|nr:TonB family protein [Acidobacteriota bacterium]